MDNLGDIRLFVEAAQQGSLSAAGRKMGLTPAAASARLAKLEAGLKARLFERTTRQLRLTDEGRLAWTIGIYLWISVSMLFAWLAKAVEPTRVGRFLTPVLVHLVGYGPLQCAITVDAFVRDLRGADTRWEKTEKRGRVVA